MYLQAFFLLNIFFREINFTKKNSISFKYNNQLATSIWFFIIHSFIHLINTNNKTKQMYVNIYTRLKSNILPCFLALVEATTERVAPQGSLHIICPIYRSWLCRETLLQYNMFWWLNHKFFRNTKEVYMLDVPPQ